METKNIISDQYSQINESDLIDAARKGCVDSFNQLVVQYQEVVYRQAYWILLEADAAEDITQEVFLKAYMRLTGFRGGSLRAWLLRTTRNACMDEFRRLRRRGGLLRNRRSTPDGEYEPADWLADPHINRDSFDEFELRELLDQSVKELPALYRSVVFLVDILEMDYQEAAGIMNIPLGTVKSRLARARQLLREKLEPHVDASYLPGITSAAHQLQIC